MRATRPSLVQSHLLRIYSEGIEGTLPGFGDWLPIEYLQLQGLKGNDMLSRELARSRCRRLHIDSNESVSVVWVYTSVCESVRGSCRWIDVDGKLWSAPTPDRQPFEPWASATRKRAATSLKTFERGPGAVQVSLLPGMSISHYIDAQHFTIRDTQFWIVTREQMKNEEEWGTNC